MVSAAKKNVFAIMFGHTDLKISLSGAKFDAEADFDVRFSVACQNPRQIDKKRILFVRKFRRKSCLRVDASTPRRVFGVSKNETSEIV